MDSFGIREYVFEWNGHHTVGVRHIVSTREVDVFSLNYERDDYTLDEVKASALEWFEEWG